MKILHSPINSAGQASKISKAQRKFGVISDVLVFNQNDFGYNADINLNLNKRKSIARKLVTIFALLKCVLRYDVFHFHCAKSFLPGNVDILFLRLLGKIVIMEYWGSDIIQLNIAKEYTLWTDKEIESIYPHINDVNQRRKIAHLAEICDKTICGDYSLIPYSPKSMVIRQAVGLEHLPYVGVSNNIIPVIVHAPTNRSIKGTEDILKVLTQLRKKGIKFRLRLVENITHKEAIEVYKTADIVIDEIRQGPYGSLAIECLALGKPVICRRDIKFEKYYKDCPIINADKNTLYTSLHKLIQKPELRKKLSRQGRTFIEKHHRAEIIADQFIDLYLKLKKPMKPDYKIDNFVLNKLSDRDLPYVDWRLKENIVTRHPVQLAEKILQSLGSKLLKRAEKYAKELLFLGLDTGNKIFFPYQFDFPIHGNKGEILRAPWFSAMAQGQALSGYVRLYKKTKKEQYLKICNKIFCSFLSYKNHNYPWILDISNGYIWLEEYPCEYPCRVLNGFNYAIFGLYDYWLLTSDKNCRKMLFGALTTLKMKVSLFRNPHGVSFYCLKHRRKSVHYHKVHIDQLQKLYQITGDIYFKEMAEKFYQDYH